MPDKPDSLSIRTRRRLLEGKPRGRRNVLPPNTYKRERVESGRGCEVCGWILSKGNTRSLHTHHIVPISCGGSDREYNLAVLCPNHHAAAHQTGKRCAGVWNGPVTKQELFTAINQLEAVRDLTAAGLL